ncbi:unnamed protein product [Macrosiphum euphorbiae]|uniref:DUF4817 domain-containing protein n=1 Tax=Macrosiphum euphorbiae TaxID=13131 RepID=A0AAV0WWP7_9HEMI|nr:unnamed protein product [Macrosiphum euphorbiae]
MAWHGEHRAFVVEEYIRNGGSAITTQRAFRIRFQLGRHDPVPDRKTIQVWLSNFRATGSALKRKSSGRPLTATTPDNVARVSASIQQSPRRSELKHAAVFTRNHKEVWFQQDGATAHTSRRSLTILREMFPGHLLSLRGDITWPPRSPDLSPCDFFLWGHLKAQVYTHRPTSLEARKEAITQEVAAITPQMTRRAMENFRERLRKCINNRGQYLTDIMFKTK